MVTHHVMANLTHANVLTVKFQSQFFEKLTGFGGKLGKNAPNMAFFGALRANRGTFLLIYSKSAENKMSFEIHVTTIATGSLSFGLKNR